MKYSPSKSTRSLFSLLSSTTALAPDLRWRMILLGSLYFSQGVPFGFFSQALPPLLRSYDVDVRQIGLISLVALPWALKFLWAPYVDRYRFGTLGPRKSWILPMQAGFILCLAAIALQSPQYITGEGLYVLLLILALSNLFAATQDIATDGLAVDSLAPHERGYGNSLQVAGYRVGMVAGGGGLLLAIDALGWTAGFLVICGLIAVASIPVWRHDETAPKAQAASTTAENSSGPQHFWPLFLSFVKRPAMKQWLAVVILYKCADSLGSAMGKPFLVDAGLSLGTIGWLSGGVAMLSGIVGALLGGWLIPRIGRVPALLAFGALQALSFLGYFGLAQLDQLALSQVAAVVLFEHFTGGLATVALFTAMMDACRPDHAGVDYTLQASFQVVITGGAHAISGLIVHSFGYGQYFLLAFGLGFVVLVPVLIWARSQRQIGLKGESV